MGKNLIALAIPFFFLCIGLEILLARRAGRRVYRLHDAYADIGCGIVQQALGVLYGSAILAADVWVHDHAALVDLRSTALEWAVALVGIDFLYYWWHRASHRVNALWAAHVVHHQSEDMNLAVALRQAPATNFTIFPFYLPMAFVVPPLVFAGAAAINTLYQFWIHTDLVPKLGPIEWVFNTPSHHRAHHGINPRYIDKNYGGILIVWDRLFGTFEEESEPVVYGTVEPLRSFDPVWAQVHPWVQLGRMARRAPRILDKLRLWLMPPEWAPAGVPAHAPPAPATPESRPRWDVTSSRFVAGYVLFQLAAMTVATFLLLLFKSSVATGQAAVVVAAVLVTLLAGAALIEGRRWAWGLEVARVASIAGVAALFLV